MNIAFAGTGYISKIHAQAARNLGLTLTAVVNHRPESRDAFAAHFGIARQYDTVDALLREIAERLQSRLGTRVSLRQSGKGGTITIHYYSDEELSNLISTLLE